MTPLLNSNASRTALRIGPCLAIACALGSDSRRGGRKPRVHLGLGTAAGPGQAREPVQPLSRMPDDAQSGDALSTAVQRADMVGGMQLIAFGRPTDSSQ